MAPNTGTYVLASAAQTASRIDLAVLRAAVGELCHRHPMLRATFHERDGEPVRRLHDSLEPAVAEVDAGIAPGEVDRQLRAMAHTPFDLETGPLWRVTVFRTVSDRDVLLLASHHLVSDFWSMGVLARELGTLYTWYAGSRKGRAPVPRAPMATYDTWAADRLRQLDASRGEKLDTYWHGRLAGAPTTLELPTDRPRPPMQTYRGAAQSLRAASELGEGVCAMARRLGSTLHAALLATFQVLLHRLTGQDDLLVGVPAAGRDDAAFAAVVGYFVNPVVLRSGLGVTRRFDDLLAETRERLHEAYVHQDQPFPRLAEALLRHNRDASRSPVFQAMFTLLRPPVSEPGLAGLPAFALGEPGGRLEIGGLSLESLRLEPQASAFDLSLSVGTSQADGLLASLTFNTDLFDRTTAGRWLRSWQVLLGSAVDDPSSPVVSLPWHTPAQLAQLLREWSGTHPFSIERACLHEFFARQASRHGDRVALRSGRRVLTYGDLARHVRRTARFLRRLDIGPEVRVGVCLERGPDVVLAVLAVLEAGGAYVPLDPAYPATRLRFMVEDSGAAVVVTERPGGDAFTPSGDARGIALSRHRSAIAKESDEELEPLGHPGNLAYVIYTSGSTGRPKGVAIEHGPAVALARWAAEAFGEREQSGVLAATSVCFDLSVYEIFATLAQGGTIVLARDAPELATLPGAEAVRLVNTVPSAISGLLDVGGLPASVRTVNLAGEPLVRDLVDCLYAAGVERVWNLYGPTEHTTYATGARIVPGSGKPSIGRPIEGNHADVCDRDACLVPLGVIGELFLGGAGLARGYLGRGALTAERFVPDPRREQPGARLYRTGDLARWLPRGELEFLGRVDHQVKVRGFRVEPGEVERVLTRHPAVSGVAVLASGGRLVAWLVKEPKSAEEQVDWRRFLSSRLPAYMVPDVFAELDELPLTPNGKIDRNELERRALPTAGPAEGFEAPRSSVEQALAEIWRDVLGVPNAGIHHGFFALGGHSLLGVRMLARARDVLGVELPLTALFEAPTIAQLARRIEAARGGADRGDVVPVPLHVPTPLSSAQQRLWIVDQLNPGRSAYNLPFFARLEGELDPAALAGALVALAQRHEALRTRFERRGTDLVQTIAKAPETGPGLVDLGALVDGLRESESRRLAHREARRCFDLNGGALARCAVVRESAGRHVLLLCVHHTVADGISGEVMFRELAALYAAACTGRPSSLVPLSVRYADYVHWQRSWLDSGQAEASLAYWKQQLADAPPVLELPTDRPRPAAQSLRGAIVARPIPAALSGRLRELTTRSGATLFMALAMAFKALLRRYTGQTDVVLGTPVANRDRTQLEGMVGLLVNTLALRTDLAGDPDATTLLERVRATVLSAFDHQDLPFERLMEALDPERGAAHSPIFQVFFALLPMPAESFESSGLEIRPLVSDTGGSRFDLTLTMVHGPSDAKLVFEYSTDLFDASTVRRLGTHYLRLLAGIAERPDLALSSQPLAGDAELHQLLSEWNDTTVPLVDSALAHSAVQALAAADPGAEALVAANTRLSRGELARRAEALARHLAALGVAPGRSGRA